MPNVALILKRVEACEVSTEWSSIDHLLGCANEYWEEHYTIDQLRQLLLSGLMQFWYLRRDGEDEPYLGALSQIMEFGKKEVFRVVWLGGTSLEGMTDFMWVLELWAAKMGCEDVEIACREGIRRLLQPNGYEKTHVVLRKRLINVSSKEH